MRFIFAELPVVFILGCLVVPQLQGAEAGGSGTPALAETTTDAVAPPVGRAAVDVSGTWSFVFVFPPHPSQNVSYLLAPGGTGVNVTYNEAEVSWTFDGTTLQVTDLNSGGDIFVFSGKVTNNGRTISAGTVTAGTSQGTFTGAKQVVTPIAAKLKYSEADARASDGASADYETYEWFVSGSLDLISNPVLAAIPPNADLELTIKGTTETGSIVSGLYVLAVIKDLSQDSKGNYVRTDEFAASPSFDVSNLPGQWVWPKNFKTGSRLSKTIITVETKSEHTTLKFSSDIRGRRISLTANDSKVQGGVAPYAADLAGSAFSGSNPVSFALTFTDSNGHSLTANFSGDAKEKITQKPLSPKAKKAAVTSTVTLQFSGSSK